MRRRSRPVASARSGASAVVVPLVALALAVTGCGSQADEGADGHTSPPADSVAPSDLSFGPTTPIVLVSVDTLRSDRLPAYGYDAVDTPAIDDFRSEAILFERAYTPMGLTLPAHASILTGRWPVDHGVRDNIGYRVPDDVPLLQTVLGEHGYQTHAAVSSYVLRGTTGLARGFERYDDGLRVTSGKDLGQLQRTGLATLEATIGMLEERDRTRPPFVFFHIYEPHTPNDPPEPFRSRYASAYDAEVAEADLVLGRLFDALRRFDLYEDALIVFLSDHGEGLGDHGEYEHEVFVYREVLQVPLIVRLPGGLRGGTTVSRPAQLVDVLPTVLDLAGIDAGPDRSVLRGQSLFSDLRGDRTIFSESVYPRIHLGWSDLASMIQGRYHFIQAPEPELYDLAHDPGETVNIIQEHRPVARRLATALEAIDRSIRPPAQIDEETRRRLERLGYLGGTSPRAGPLPDPKNRIHLLGDLEAAATALANGDLETAVRGFRRITTDDPGMVYAWEQLGSALRTAGDFQGAIDAYESAMEASPTGSGPAALSLAEIHLESGDLETASQYADIASKTQDAGYDLLAQIALQRGNLEEARTYVDTAVSRRSGRIEPLVTEVSLLVAEQRFQEALEAVAEAKREFGRRSDAEALEGLAFERGRALMNLNRLDEAQAAFREEIERSPNELAPYTFLSLALALDGDPAGAVGALRAMVEANDHPAAFAEAVRALRALGDPEGAESLLRTARSRFPTAETLAEL